MQRLDTITQAAFHRGPDRRNPRQADSDGQPTVDYADFAKLMLDF
jgi:hypothetical protein